MASRDDLKLSTRVLEALQRRAPAEQVSPMRENMMEDAHKHILRLQDTPRESMSTVLDGVVTCEPVDGDEVILNVDIPST